MDQQTIKEITVNDLLAEVLKLKNEGCRLVAITCTAKDSLELSYSFDQDYDLISLRIITDTETEIASITAMYPYAFLYENEIKELFGANIININLDFDNNLYKIPVRTPFNIRTVESEQNKRTEQ